MSKTTATAKTETNVLAKYDAFPTKSAKIRTMAADGMKRSAIAKTLGIRYQHVRNVLTAPAPKKKELL